MYVEYHTELSKCITECEVNVGSQKELKLEVLELGYATEVEVDPIREEKILQDRMQGNNICIFENLQCIRFCVALLFDATI